MFDKVALAAAVGLSVLGCGTERVRFKNPVPSQSLIYTRCSLSEARLGTPVGDVLPRSASCTTQSNALFENALLLLDPLPLWTEASGHARATRYSRAAGFPELFVVVTLVPLEKGELSVVVRRDRLQRRYSDRIQPEFIKRTMSDIDGQIDASCFSKEMVNGDPAASKSSDDVTAIEVLSGDRYAVLLSGNCKPDSATPACRCQSAILAIAKSLWKVEPWELAPPPPGMSY